MVQDSSGQWELPGGRLENSEEPLEGLRREIKEELSIDIEPVRIFGTYVFQSDKTNHYVVVYLCKPIGTIEKLKVNGVEIVEMKWVTKDNYMEVSVGKAYTGEVLCTFFGQAKVGGALV